MKKNWLSVCGVVVLCVGMVACGKEIPEDIIQPEAMEDLLYDYHMASTMANSLPYSENYKKDAYFKYVFQKHGVTQAEFDSSMVWYTRHSKMLADIYNNLGERYCESEDYLKRLAEKREGKKINVFPSGDKVDIWQDRTLYWLTTASLTNRVDFEMKTDTTFHAQDRLELSADFAWMPGVADTSRFAVMALNIEFKNDSTFGKTYRVHTSGRHTLVLQPDSAYEFKNVSGFIYYDGKSAEQTQLLVHRIGLKRIHCIAEDIKGKTFKDSVAKEVAQPGNAAHQAEADIHPKNLQTTDKK